MSGIIGILNLNGAPVTPGLLQRMMEPMDARWPDALGTWSEGSVALGHAMLRATDESASERQPLSLDGLAMRESNVVVQAGGGEELDVAASLRIGITKAVDWPLRFAVRGSKWVSRTA